MPIVCAKSLREYPWIVNRAMPHERGEPQPSVTRCDCEPVFVSDEEFLALRDAAWKRLEETGSAIMDDGDL